ncbi:MAG: MscL family protein [Candidatus Dojkabacteria bacterium]|nr:MscL family protein [Candidatus Dojkabacteria bacterium]
MKDVVVQDFLSFIRERGVIGLAVAFVLGRSVSDVVSAIVEDIVNPLLGLILGRAEGLAEMSFEIADAEIKYGHLLSVLIDFLVIALIVYVVVHKLGLEKLDKKKETK